MLLRLLIVLSILFSQVAPVRAEQSLGGAIKKIFSTPTPMPKPRKKKSVSATKKKSPTPTPSPSLLPLPLPLPVPILPSLLPGLLK